MLLLKEAEFVYKTIGPCGGHLCWNVPSLLKEHLTPAVRTIGHPMALL